MIDLSSVDIVGGGPAGLYLAILLRRQFPGTSVRVTEQNPKGATFGFGVVFSDQALDFLKTDDPETHALVTGQMERWQNMVLNHPDGQVTIDGVGFSAVGRLDLIEILRQRAEELGVSIRFDTTVASVEDFTADLVVGADGLNSRVRQAHEAAFQPSLEHFDNHFAWFGAPAPFHTLTQTFVSTPHGPLNAHHYRYTPDQSTFIVECEDAVFQAHGFAHMSEVESAEACASIFAEVLGGTGLITNHSAWRRFPRLWCKNWVAGRHVLIGDAAHTAHFSIGSGTRLAMEDAIALTHALHEETNLDAALALYQSRRQPIAHKIVEAANTSANWYETFSEKMRLPPLDFAFDYITRSGRIDMDRLRRMAPRFMQDYEASKAMDITDPLGDTATSAGLGFSKADHPNCSEILWQNLARNPDKPAITGPGGTLTYRALIREAARWGNAFRAAGLQRGERIALFLDDTPAYPAAFFGAVRAGFVPVLLNIQTKSQDLNYFLKDSGARIAVTEAGLVSMFAGDTLSDTALNTLVAVNGDPGDAIAAETFLNDQPTELAVTGTGPDDMAFWMYSSGSTGRPKGIVHLHHDMAYTNASYGKTVLQLGLDDIVFSVPKIYFAYGFGNTFTFPFSIGATSVLLPHQPRPEAVLDTIEAYKPTVFFGLPTLYTALARSKGISDRDLGSIRKSMSAAETLSSEIYTAWKNLTGHGPTEGLGSTEMLHIYLSNRLDDHRLGAAGAPVQGYDIRLETPDGKPAGDGEEGVMLVRGQSSAPGYWNRPDKTRNTMRGEWIYTGDRFVERDGYFYFQGRADDLIKVSGQWVWPLEVERCLAEHPQVHECAVLAYQMDDKRMALRAVVCPSDHTTAGSALTETLRAFVKDRLTPFKSPRLFEYVPDLPKTGTGKIDRQALAASQSQGKDLQ